MEKLTIVGREQFVWQMHCVGICVVFVVLVGMAIVSVSVGKIWCSGSRCLFGGRLGCSV